MMKRLLAGILSLLMAFSLAACGSGGSSPEKVAERYVELVYKGDADGVLKLIVLKPEERDKPGVEDMLRGKIKAMMAKAQEKADKAGGVKDITAAPANYSEDKQRAAVQVTVTFKKSDTPDVARIRLFHTDDGWKINL
ncbi:DUF4878 domain-containing protein [Paralysiella testudinis]|uniref:DUF4878 domain-containing protein n=1 Tax=Paralysiella testudinis TaxID=2809020 RepID=A0A892ZIW3_9NEIS|nr:DUF4878 domain-containing protein [Paralysiella testudinis]QRQ82872.1 DUF4878 domain-containing protein [Paralysiella testudinis]